PERDTLSLHDALPIFPREGRADHLPPHAKDPPARCPAGSRLSVLAHELPGREHDLLVRLDPLRAIGLSPIDLDGHVDPGLVGAVDRKSTRLNSSHVKI